MYAYFAPKEYPLRRISFRYKKGYYSGRGLLTWKPETGFYIEAPVERRGKPDGPMSMFGTKIVRQDDVSVIRMQLLQNGWRAVAPQVPLVDRMDLLLEHRLSVRIGQVVFFGPEHNALTSADVWKGTALFQYAGHLIFPDCVRTETYVGEQRVYGLLEKKGLQYQGVNGYKVEGRVLRDEFFAVEYVLPRSSFSKADAWRWPEAFRDALSACSNQSALLLNKATQIGSRQREDCRQKSAIYGFAPFEFFRDPRLKARWLTGLADFMAHESSEARVCRGILRQMTAVSIQKTWQARELLLSTILEAALRTLENKPQVPGKKDGYSIKQGLQRVNAKYFHKQWGGICDETIQVFDRLRHRNAHPDWLYEETGALSDETKVESLRDMRFLSRFYGQMILALSRVDTSDPFFANGL